MTNFKGIPRKALINQIEELRRINLSLRSANQYLQENIAIANREIDRLQGTDKPEVLMERLRGMVELPERTLLHVTATNMEMATKGVPTYLL